MLAGECSQQNDTPLLSVIKIVKYLFGFPHSNGANVLFVDTHVEWLPIRTVPTQENVDYGDRRIFWYFN